MGTPATATKIRLTRDRQFGNGGAYFYRGLRIRRVQLMGCNAVEWQVTHPDAGIVHQAPTLGRVREWLAGTEAARHFEQPKQAAGPLVVKLVKDGRGDYAGRYTYRGVRIRKMGLLRASGLWWTVTRPEAPSTSFFSARTLQGVREWLATDKAEPYFTEAATEAPRPAGRTALVRSAASSTGDWCWEASLKVLGMTPPTHWLHPWTGRKVKHPTGWQIEQKVAQRYDMERLKVWDDASLAKFIADHPEGTYWLDTRGHVMVLQNGILTDTALRMTGRRQLLGAYRLTPKAA